jgi:ElaB/YqjD/DUF883 family membrane-anchored ribosome-binding protein
LTCLKLATVAPLLTQIKWRYRRLTYYPFVKTMRVSTMFNSSGLSDELQALKSEVSRLLNNTGDGMFDAAKTRADALADQIKSALNELGETLSEQEDQVEALIAERPVATVASAFALGVVIGFMLRRP